MPFEDSLEKDSLHRESEPGRDYPFPTWRDASHILALYPRKHVVDEMPHIVRNVASCRKALPRNRDGAFSGTPDQGVARPGIEDLQHVATDIGRPKIHDFRIGRDVGGERSGISSDRCGRICGFGLARVRRLAALRVDRRRIEGNARAPQGERSGGGGAFSRSCRAWPAEVRKASRRGGRLS